MSSIGLKKALPPRTRRTLSISTHTDLAITAELSLEKAKQTTSSATSSIDANLTKEGECMRVSMYKFIKYLQPPRFLILFELPIRYAMGTNYKIYLRFIAKHKAQHPNIAKQVTQWRFRQMKPFFITKAEQQ